MGSWVSALCLTAAAVRVHKCLDLSIHLVVAGELAASAPLVKHDSCLTRLRSQMGMEAML